jgi:hypothetical protein
MRAWPWIVLALALPQTAAAKEDSPQEYGVGLICPRADTQASFYTENDQQDAAGTIGYDAAAGFTITSDTVKSLAGAGAHTMESLCDGGMAGIRIDGKRDGWLQAGKLWLPPNQEWDYADWQDFLHKAAVWKALAPVVLYQGSMEAPSKDKPYPTSEATGKIEIYPLKFVDDYALVVLDKTGAFAKACAGTPFPPEGMLGWLRISSDTGRPVAVPIHLKGC